LLFFCTFLYFVEIPYMPSQTTSPNLIGYYRTLCTPPLLQTELAELLGASIGAIKNWEKSGCAKSPILFQILKILIERGAIQNRKAALHFWEVSGNRRHPLVQPAELKVLLDQLPMVEHLDLQTPPRRHILPDCSYIPYERYHAFTGRSDELKKLATLLQPGLALTVVAGMAGMGKTQLAIEFAYRYGQLFSGGVFWVSLVDSHKAQLDLVECGKNMHAHDDFVTLPLETQVQIVRDLWEHPEPRLLIFDNCDDPQLLAEWMPRKGGCRLLVTTRQIGWEHWPARVMIELGALSAHESVSVLRNVSGWQAGYAAELDAIAAELEHLPLGLFLAARYLKKYRAVLHPAAYLSGLREMRLHHPSIVASPADGSPTRYKTPLETAFALSYQRLHPGELIGLDALDVLARIVHFAVGEPVPRALLIDTFEQASTDWLRRVEIEDAIQLLLDLGLVTTTLSDALRIHRLVFYVVQLQERVQREQQTARAAVEQAVIHLAKQSDDDRDLSLMAILSLHLRSLADSAASRSDDDAIQISYWCGWLLGLIHNRELSLKYCNQMRDLVLQRYGSDHPKLADSYNLIGVVSMMQTLYVVAQDSFQQAITIWEKSHGDRHELTTLGYQNYAYLLALRGDYPRALLFARRALRAVHRRGESADLAVARRLHIIGWALQSSGRLHSALRCLQLALRIRKHMLPENHIAIFLTSAILGDTLLHMNRVDEAETIYQHTYTGHVAAYGEKKPFSGELLHRIAKAKLVRGMVKEAIATLRTALRVLDLSVGEHGMDSVHCRFTLAEALVRHGNHEEAWRHYQIVYRMYADQLIEGHPDTRHVQQRIAEIAAKYPRLVE
jgi:tetratricopeptide (TPR) repeat protein